MQFGRSFNLLRRSFYDHEIVNESSAQRCVSEKTVMTNPARNRPHNIDRASLTPRRPDGFTGLFREAGDCPVFAPLARRFPFFAPLSTRRAFSLPLGADNWGDCQMNIRASGRSALIIAAGFWVCVPGPLQAAADADGGAAVYEAETAAGPPVALNKFVKKSRHWKRASSQRKSVKVASQDSSEPAKTSEKKISVKKKTLEANAALNDDGSAPSLPPSVANANAQLASADSPADSATALSSQARNRLQVMAANQSDPQAQSPAANAELVAADQLNDVDRALSENRSDDKDKSPSATLAMAVAQAPAQPQAAAVGTDDSAWGQTSLIGKIFIAFGGLLTLASAARMFMA
jgi:hypothetical protein